MHNGYTFEVHDVKDHKKIRFNAPEEIYDIAGANRGPVAFSQSSAVYHRDTGDMVAVSSTEKLSLLAGNTSARMIRFVSCGARVSSRPSAEVARAFRVAHPG